MNSAPHLLTEDRAEYERVLDDALRHAPGQPELAGFGQRLNAEQLRTMALNATALITAAAAAEYEHFVRVREQLRHAARSPALSAVAPVGAEADGGPGAGLGAVVTVLAPVLAGTAAVIFLLVGYGLRLLDPAPSFAGPLLTAGWFFAAIAALGILVAGAGLLITALRNRATQVPAGGHADETTAVSEARDAWRRALLERGILPFLRDALAEGTSSQGVGPAGGPATVVPPRPGSRLPKVGYSGPEFSSPREGGSGTRPAFTSPDFSSPAHGGPDHQPE
ncbi:hypothetical protein NX801_05720 [Streptomyces sp. LP05-1]|uniref:Transmembrane protein n=1 Tax=Streptomyces pyxinae TaxID=2970734 RepID=A0ABT2CDH1_9ACTN|nr:hypothetical protein [Streptomyces sp. LP05-1]MCS0635162.1 hypothetical protein [Streptomyces sp. LP05-1]